MIDFKKLIVIEAGKRFGKPILSGTRISVQDVLSWMAHGISREQIIQDFPELNDDMLSACLWYAANRELNTRIAS